MVFNKVIHIDCKCVFNRYRYLVWPVVFIIIFTLASCTSSRYSHGYRLRYPPSTRQRCGCLNDTPTPLKGIDLHYGKV